MRRVVGYIACAAVGLLLAGCMAMQPGPARLSTFEENVEYARPLAEPSLVDFYNQPPATQAAIRNQVVTARMYVADVAYGYYEAGLTNEIQREGLLATAASLGLTTSATLLTPPGTKTILSGLATAVTGMDKAYNEKVLLANTVQALQAQMRADRKAKSAAIYAKMLRDNGGAKTLTPIHEYTLPMALSDADGYYQAGTLASALIGLSRTVANAEQSAETAKAIAGPNPEAVTTVREVAVPRANGGSPPPPVRTVRITNVATDDSRTALRAQLFPGGVRDDAVVQYVRGLVGEKVAVGVILTDARFVTLRQRISACIIARAGKNPCEPGSLSKLVQ